MIDNPFHQSPIAYLVQMQTKYAYLDRFVEAFEKFSTNIVYFEKEGSRSVESMPEDLWQIDIYLEEKPNLTQMQVAILQISKELELECPELLMSAVDDKDWVSEVQKNFIPINAGKFFIHTSNYKDEIPKGQISIEMNAGRAFGTGEHETTGNCLKALSNLSEKKFTNCLDMGCGSGILAIAMAKLWSTIIIAVDLDEQAVLVTKENLKLNNVEAIISSQSNGYDSELVNENGPYKIITSNILAAPLIAMAGDAYKHLAKGGLLILAGFIQNQVQAILDAHIKEGFTLEQIIDAVDWPVLIMKKP
jgi:ribosomal protein L11 methyltransferase